MVDSVVDDHYFVVASVSEPELRRVTSLLDPTIFPSGTYKSLRFAEPLDRAAMHRCVPAEGVALKLPRRTSRTINSGSSVLG